MNRRDQVTANILEEELSMFQAVPNVGGRASCQDDVRTFQIMRSSQMAGWSEAVLLSYLDDLKEAAMAGRNLFTEKYARMMQSTSPEEYARIEHLLPTVDVRVLELIGKIVSIVLKWERELLEKYPCVVKRGRPISSDEDSPGVISLETYLKGELATYSLRTLEFYLEHVKQQDSNGVNGSAIIRAQTVKQYGFDSLDEANERLKAR